MLHKRNHIHNNTVGSLEKQKPAWSKGTLNLKLESNQGNEVGHAKRVKTRDAKRSDI